MSDPQTKQNFILLCTGTNPGLQESRIRTGIVSMRMGSSVFFIHADPDQTLFGA